MVLFSYGLISDFLLFCEITKNPRGKRKLKASTKKIIDKSVTSFISNNSLRERGSFRKKRSSVCAMPGQRW